MTVLAPTTEDSIVIVNNGTNSMLHKHWGSTHRVQIHREPNKSLGISIVGGKVISALLEFNYVGNKSSFKLPDGIYIMLHIILYL